MELIERASGKATNVAARSVKESILFIHREKEKGICKRYTAPARAVTVTVVVVVSVAVAVVVVARLASLWQHSRSNSGSGGGGLSAAAAEAAAARAREMEKARARARAWMDSLGSGRQSPISSSSLVPSLPRKRAKTALQPDTQRANAN